MAAKTDFVFLYEQLGLRPGCTREELHRAYRRRVAALHPDRPRAGPHDPLAVTRLQELTAAYEAANVFHRRFGRLPGARQVTYASVAPPLPAPRGPSLVADGGRRKWRIALALVALGVVVWLLVMGPDGERSEAPAASPPDRTTEARPAVGAIVPRGLALGMDKTSVRAIEGEPVITTRGHWDYGPSWIDFDHDKVSDWHSSPLRPLKVNRARVTGSNRLESD